MKNLIVALAVLCSGAAFANLPGQWCNNTTTLCNYQSTPVYCELSGITDAGWCRFDNTGAPQAPGYHPCSFTGTTQCDTDCVTTSNGATSLCTALHGSFFCPNVGGICPTAPCLDDSYCAASKTYRYDGGVDYGYTLACNLSNHVAAHAIKNVCCEVGTNACSSNNDCCTGVCTSGHCVQSADSTSVAGSGGSCVDTLDCSSGAACVEGTWCKCVPSGAAATNSADCCAGIGLNGSGNCACHVTGHTCSTQAECCTGVCSSGHCT